MDPGDQQEQTHVSSAPERKQEETAAYGEGEEVNQAAEETRKRPGALHQALNGRWLRAIGRPLATALRGSRLVQNLNEPGSSRRHLP